MYESVEIDKIAYATFDDDVIQKLVLRRLGGQLVEIDLRSLGGGGGGLSSEELEAHADDLLLHSSGIELAYVSNDSAVPVAINTATTDLPLMVIDIPESARPVWVEFAFVVDVTTAPTVDTASYVAGVIVDEANVFRGWGAGVLPAGSPDSFLTVSGKGRLGPVEVPTTLRLQAYRGGNNVFRGNVMNGMTTPVWNTWMGAFTR